ncbi:MAG TPA: hypothetical protein VJ654_01025 [Noviherbaspirillum sp.]|nr:hypothetical protein [Noviherbaspirillum sp.]
MNRADRKKYLIAQGAVYRAEIMLAKQDVHAGLQSQSLARSALQQVARVAFSFIANKGNAGLPGISLQTVLPLLTAAASVLSKRKPFLKTILRSTLMAAAAASIAALIAKSKKSTSEKLDDAS